LTPEEASAWSSILARAEALTRDPAPLAQSLAWGRAINAVSGRAYAVFSPDEGVGGLVFASLAPPTDSDAPARLRFECVNGPLLAWDQAQAPRQLATFVAAVSRLHPRFESLVARPRWRETHTSSRLSLLPHELQPHGVARAATQRLDPRCARAAFDRRLLRTLRASEKAGIRARWEPVSSSTIADFAPRAAYFARTKGFSVPPVSWFLALTQSNDDSLEFARVSAEGAETGCDLLLAFHRHEPSQAHYLFGHEWRSPGARGSLSPSAIAHDFALRLCDQKGATQYDFNGFLENAPADHPYAGVSAFKAQFGGEIVRYDSPEFRFE
jgi:hypothetical protein